MFLDEGMHYFTLESSHYNVRSMNKLSERFRIEWSDGNIRKIRLSDGASTLSHVYSELSGPTFFSCLSACSLDVIQCFLERSCRLAGC